MKRSVTSSDLIPRARAWKAAYKAFCLYAPTENAVAILIPNTAKVTGVHSSNIPNGKRRISFGASGEASDRPGIRTQGKLGTGQINVQGTRVG